MGRLLVVLLTALLGLVLATRPQHARAEDLLDIYRQAKTADPVLGAADATRRVVREGVDQARAPLLPQASAIASYDQSHGGTASPQNARGATVGVNQVIVDVARLHDLKAARANAEAQDALYVAAEQALLVRVATAYFNVLSAADMLANVQANEAAFGQQVQQAGERYRQGLSAQVDVDQARAYHASARAATLAARQALADAREALAEITGSAPGALKTLRDQLPMDLPAPADPQSWVNAALDRNPLLLAQRAGVSAAEKSIDAARAGHLPTLTAGASVGRNSAWPLGAGNDGRNVTTVGVQLNVPLFSGGAQQSLVRQASYRRDAGLNDLEAARRRVTREVLERYRAVETGIGQTEATRDAVDAARKALASTRVGQGLGTQTMNELLQAIQTLGSAQGAFSSARHQFILSRLLLQQASGSVSESDLAAVNALLE